MEINAGEAEKKELVVEVNGEKFYFCSEDCLEKFKKEPLYTPTKCAECMKKCDLKKTIWKINHEEVLYCFDSEKCKNEFQKKTIWTSNLLTIVQ